MNGKLIVIEGSDASGKHTQAAQLIERLKKEGFEAELVSFPRYEGFFGNLAKKYLSGDFGAMESLGVEVPSLLYALDRYDAAKPISESLSQGKIVVADRFTASNIAHQAAKLPDEKRQGFAEWLLSVESRLPKPAVTIYLDVPVDVSQRLMQEEGRQKDLHEQNVDYLRDVRKIYLKLASSAGWKKIECVKSEKLLSISEIHELVWKAVKPNL